MTKLITVVCSLLLTVSVAAAQNEEKRSAPREAQILAQEMTSKIVYRQSNVRARAEECRLYISFEPQNAAFDLPLQGTTIAQTFTRDGIVVLNKNMTRTIRDRAPESFERLLLRFHRDQMQSMLKTFENAIATCNRTANLVTAAN